MPLVSRVRLIFGSVGRAICLRLGGRVRVEWWKRVLDLERKFAWQDAGVRLCRLKGRKVVWIKVRGGRQQQFLVAVDTLAKLFLQMGGAVVK